MQSAISSCFTLISVLTYRRGVAGGRLLPKTLWLFIYFFNLLLEEELGDNGRHLNGVQSSQCSVSF